MGIEVKVEEVKEEVKNIEVVDEEVEFTTETTTTLPVNISTAALYSEEPLVLFETFQYYKYRGTAANSTTYNYMESLKSSENANKKDLLNPDSYLNQEDAEPTAIVDQESMLYPVSGIVLPFTYLLNKYTSA